MNRTTEVDSSNTTEVVESNPDGISASVAIRTCEVFFVDLRCDGVLQEETNRSLYSIWGGQVQKKETVNVQNRWKSSTDDLPQRPQKTSGSAEPRHLPSLVVERAPVHL